MFKKLLRFANLVADVIEKAIPKSLRAYFISIRKFVGSIYTSWHKGRLAQIRFFLTCAHVIRRKKIQEYFKKRKERCLQLGGGFHSKKGWLNGDIIFGDIYLDATRKFPFPDKSFNYIFAEHFIEHFSRQGGQHILSECFRVLKPKGKIRLSTPDLHKLIKIYDGENTFVTAQEVIERHNRINGKTLSTMAEYLNDMYRMWGHKFIYDYETLKMALKVAGFVGIKRCIFGKSVDPRLSGLERHADTGWMKKGFVLIAEAEKE